MTLYEKLYAFGFFSSATIDEIIVHIKDLDSSFTINDPNSSNWYFIDQYNIQQEHRDMLLADLTMLGSVDAGILAASLQAPVSFVQEQQQAGMQESLGNSVIPVLDTVQSYLVDVEGYGPAFATYDEEEYRILNYYFFRTL
jgi:hypothetical protein